MSHYDWLRKHFVSFLSLIHFPDAKYCDGLIVAHGDKCWQYQGYWEKAGIPFEHGVAIYLLTYLSPWLQTVRQTDKGWVSPKEWVVNKYPEFKDTLLLLDSCGRLEKLVGRAKELVKDVEVNLNVPLEPEDE